MINNLPALLTQGGTALGGLEKATKIASAVMGIANTINTVTKNYDNKDRGVDVNDTTYTALQSGAPIHLTININLYNNDQLVEQRKLIEVNGESVTA